jgi:hypothetical protein
MAAMRRSLVSGSRKPALLQQVEVLDRRLGGLDLRARAFDAVAVDFRQRDAERIIDARGAAGENVDEFLRLGAGHGNADDERSTDEAREGLGRTIEHGHSSLKCSVLAEMLSQVTRPVR